MSRSHEEQFEQDRHGNVNRKLDRIRAQDGMDADGNGGIVEVVTADVGTDLVLYELPDSVDAVTATEVHAYNGDAADGTFSLYSAELDAGGAITSTTRRSVPIEVVQSATRIHSYKGKEFSADAIVVNSSFEGFIGVGVVADNKEETETTVHG